jgi:hypothetical protein
MQSFSDSPLRPKGYPIGFLEVLIVVGIALSLCQAVFAIGKGQGMDRNGFIKLLEAEYNVERPAACQGGGNSLWSAKEGIRRRRGAEASRPRLGRAPHREEARRQLRRRPSGAEGRYKSCCRLDPGNAFQNWLLLRMTKASGFVTVRVPNGQCRVPVEPVRRDGRSETR